MIANKEKKEDTREEEGSGYCDLFIDTHYTQLGFHRDYTKKGTVAKENDNEARESSEVDFDDLHETLLGIHRNYIGSKEK
jgi:hypothetical protein